MKHRIKNYVSIIVALSMLLSLIPLYGAALDDEFEGVETLEEVPFEFELESGDLPFEELAEATLSAEDIPACIDPALAEARGHVNRLYLQEPDDHTVMFQNRDGSKTVYVFSQPVKGSAISTSFAIQVNNGTITFSGSNIITSRIGVDLFDYNIGYCEIQTLTNGILSADGVNITADAREWARDEYIAGSLEYNMSSEAAAEYAASIVQPDADVSLAAVTPGVTITPNDPAPIGGITVMAISYSDLAGLMSFKNVSTNQYLTLTTSTSPSLTTNSSIVDPYSRWYVQYDSEIGYYVSNLSDVYNTYLGFSGTNVLFLNSAPDAESGFTLSIVSQSDSTVTIDCYEKAIDSNGSIYVTSSVNYEFPTSCEWKIMSKTNTILVSGIAATSATRVEQSGVDFYLDYTITPSTANNYDISLYDATTNQEITYDTEAYEDEYAYYIEDPGVYTVYYKDSITGVKSADFTLIVTETSGAGQPVSFASNHTYAIQPYGYGDKFLTMQDKDNNGTTANLFRVESLITEWYNQSQTFVFNTASGDSYSRTIFATLSTVQSGAPANYRENSTSYNGTYYYPNVSNINNALHYTSVSGLIGKIKSDTNSTVQVYDIGGYYVLSFGLNSNNKILALKYNANAAEGQSNVTVAEYSPNDTSFRWNITYVGIDTPLIKQTHSAGCGATATLMYTYGMGLDEIDSTVNLTALQTELRTALNFNLDTYIIVDNIKNYINGMYEDLNINPQSDYCYYYTSDAEQLSKLSNNIASQNIMIARVTMLDLNYYDNNVRGTYHYINIVGKIVINGANKYVVMDCHYDDTYFGIHIIDEEELVEAITHLIAKQ